MHKSFKFAGDYYTQLLRLKTRRERAEYALAIVEYGCAGVEPHMSDNLMFGFDGIRSRIDGSVRAAEDMERRSEAGRKAAAARWGNDANAPCETDAGASCETDAGASCKERRGEERRGEAAAAASCDGMTEEVEGKLFLDSEDGVHGTRREALEATYRIRSGRDDYDRFVERALDGRCAGCDGSCAGECFETLRAALMAWDGSKAKTPVPLAKKMLAEEVFS